MNRNERLASRAGRNALREAERSPERTERSVTNPPSPYASMKYRDEFGVRMTQEDYDTNLKKREAWQGDIDTYNTQLSEVESKILAAEKDINSKKNEYLGKINSARKELDKASSTTLDSLYADARKSWIPVGVVSPTNEIEGYYYLPKEAIPKLKEMPAYQKWSDDGRKYYISVMMEGYVRGQELHDALRDAEKDLKLEFYRSSQPQLEEQRALLRTEYDKLNSTYNQLMTSYQEEMGKVAQEKTTVKLKRNEVQKALDDYETMIARNKEDYQERLALRRKLLG